MKQVTPHLFIDNKSKEVTNIEIIGDIGYNVWADTYDDYKKNTSERISEEVKAISGATASDTINVTLESLGGDASHALSIYSILKNSGKTINVYMRGANASASTVIASSATSKDHVYMSNTGMFLIHKPMTSAYGNENDMEKAKEHLSKWAKAIENAYISLGVDKADLDMLMEKNGGHGEWLTFDEAKAYGFVGKEWTSESTLNYTKDLFKTKNLLTPKNIKMEENKEVKDENLLTKIWNKLNTPTNMEEEEEEVKNEVTLEDFEALLERVALLEEKLAEMEEPENMEEEEEYENMEEEEEDENKVENSLKLQLEDKIKEIENLKKQVAKNEATPKPKEVKNKLEENAPAWKQLVNAHKNQLK